ncbi:MAG: hypothetical protein GY696_37515, partial [Gammaproteobacteria bacterium]|nr:hypothetical protein [Gammaproteobacteria bacterium]
LGTRCTATPADLGPGSAWQDGPSWLQLPESSWPTKDNIHGEVPAAELPAMSAELESRPNESEEPPDAAPQQKPTPGWFPIKNYSCLRFAKKVMVRILKAADGFLIGLENTDLAKGRIRATNYELRASAHTLLIASCHEIDTSAKGLKLIKNLSPTVMSLPVSKTARADVVMMSAQIPTDLAMSQDANQRPIVNGRNHLGKLI